MNFRVRLYGVSRHEDGAKRNPNGQCGGDYINKKFSSLIDFFIIMHKQRFRYMVSSANQNDFAVRALKCHINCNPAKKEENLIN